MDSYAAVTQLGTYSSYQYGKHIKALGLFYWAKKKYSDGTFFYHPGKTLDKNLMSQKVAVLGISDFTKNDLQLK